MNINENRIVITLDVGSMLSKLPVFLWVTIVTASLCISCTEEIAGSENEADENEKRFEWVSFKPAASYFVATGGNDTTGDGSPEKPWATIRSAINNVPDNGSEIVVKAGTYRQAAYITRKFAKKCLIRAEEPYHVMLQAPEKEHRVFYFSQAENIILAGFEMKGNPDGSGDYLMQIETCENIALENNIMHDSYDNDILKINNMTINSAIRGNLFYNQPSGGDEHIDANVVRDVVIEDNVFFNDFGASGRTVGNNTHPFVLVKSSTSDANRASRNVNIRRNVFLNWQGSADQPFLLLGEDAQPFYEAENVMVENNLFICNTEIRMSAAFCIKGVKDVVFRANTVTGYVFHVSFGYGIRVGREGSNPPNANIQVYNNIFSDPSGRMSFFSGGQKSNLENGTLHNNLYFNNGAEIAERPENAFTPAMDTKKVVGNPMLASPLSGVVTPVWNGNSYQFRGGAKTIEDVRINLINNYGAFTSTASVAIDAADPAQMPSHDIYCNPRDAKPDIGACEK